MSFLFFSCDEKAEFVLSDVPRISLLDVSHDTIREFEDDLIISIHYEDGNGDLGFEETDRFALFIRDIRLENFDGFYIGPIAPPDIDLPISGVLNTQFPDLFLFGNGTEELTRFEIKMIDRMQNESNILLTQEILIVAR